MSVASKLMTWQEFMNLPDDGQRHELVRGEVVTTPPAETDHDICANNINISLGYHVKQNMLGWMSGQGGFVVADHPDTVRAADVSFIAAHRLPTGKVGKGYFRGAPDLLVEVVLPNDRLYDVEEKVEEWLAAGARLIWVVNPRRKIVIAHRPGAEPQTFRVGDTLDAADVVPGFTLPVAEIFA